MKLELGCGDKPTEGYLHQDIASVNGTKLDYECSSDKIDLPDNSLEEIIALGVMEHMNEEDFKKTFVNMCRMLADGGAFLFDVPDMKYWFKYAVDNINGYDAPFEAKHIENTILGWRRFPGDEHKSFWWLEKMEEFLVKTLGVDNLWKYDFDFDIDSRPYMFTSRDFNRNRFSRWETDRHLYVMVYKLPK